MSMVNDSKYKWARQLRRARKHAGDTQSDVALRFGLHEQTINRWEKGYTASPLGDGCEMIRAYVGRHLDEDVEFGVR